MQPIFNFRTQRIFLFRVNTVQLIEICVHVRLCYKSGDFANAENTALLAVCF